MKKIYLILITVLLFNCSDDEDSFKDPIIGNWSVGDDAVCSPSSAIIFLVNNTMETYLTDQISSIDPDDSTESIDIGIELNDECSWRKSDTEGYWSNLDGNNYELYAEGYTIDIKVNENTLFYTAPDGRVLMFTRL